MLLRASTARRVFAVSAIALTLVGIPIRGAAGTTFEVLHTFDSADEGRQPSTGVVEGSDGALYGTTRFGGASGGPCVFRMNKDGSGYAILHRFPNYSYSQGLIASLIEGSDGMLYGSAFPPAGGIPIIFRLTLAGDFTVLKEGASPVSPVIEGSDGALYWTDGYGIHRINGNGTGYHSVQLPEGVSPNVGLTEGNDRRLYGVRPSTVIIFPHMQFLIPGTLVSFNKDGSDFRTLYRFEGSYNGPQARVIEATDGALYSTIDGSIFRVKKDGTSFTNFPARTANGALVEWVDGKLYAIGWELYPTGWRGSVVSIGKNGSAYEVIHGFADTNAGAAPFSALIPGRDGALYGTAANGGPAGGGTVYRLKIAPALSVPQISKDGRVHFHVEGVSGQSVTVQASSDIANWVTLSLGMVTNGTLTISDVEAITLSRRFYRVKLGGDP